MTNTIETLTFIATQMLKEFKNNLQFCRNLDGENFTNRFTQTPKVGESFTIRKQAMFSGRTGETYSAEDYTERTVTVSVQSTAGVDVSITNRELMFSLDQMQQRVIRPKAMQLASIVDTAALKAATQATYNTVGTPGTVPSTLSTYNSARAKQVWQACPMDSHTLLITPDMQVNAVDAAKALFAPNTAIGSQYEQGTIQGNHYGAKVYEIQNPYTHTVGPLGGTPLVNGASQTGATLVTDGWTAAAASRLKKGDVFTIANVHAVNPFTRASTGSLAQFVVTADFSSDGTGAGSVGISPAIVTSGPYQNVDAGPADNAAITVLGAASTVTPQGFRFQRDSFIFGTCEQPEPGGVWFAKTVVDKDTGISIRLIHDWDTTNNKVLTRADVVWAFGVAFPEWACRIAS